MYKYYGNREGLLLKINSILDISPLVSSYKVTYPIVSVDLIDNGSVELEISEVEEGPRTISIMSPFEDVYIIRIIGEEGNLCKNLREDLKYKFLAYSETEQQAILNDMPLLKEYRSIYEGSFNNVALIWRDHFVEDSLGLLKTFVKMGLDPSFTIVFDKGDATLHRKEIWETFKNIGFGVYKLDNAEFNKGNNSDSVIEVNNILQEFINEAAKHNKKILIMDDGAFVTRFLSRETNNIEGIIELTEMGLRRIASSKLEINCPILNVAKSDLKRFVTYPEIGLASVLRIQQLLGAEKIIGRKILVLGYGDAGMNICKKLKYLGVNVSVVDPDPLKLITAAEDGFNTYDNVTDAILLEQPFIVIGASGYSSITKEDIQLLPNNSYITTVATADLAVLKDEFFNTVKQRKIPGYGTQYFLNSKTLTLLGNGRSVNLYESESIPSKAIDLFKSAILLSAVLLIERRDSLKNGLNKNVINEWLYENDIFRKYYNLYFKNHTIDNTTEKLQKVEVHT
ncbi:hypothetical protein [Bacillus infantis]|nr:hypothetical protein [Bacillus infantis]